MSPSRAKQHFDPVVRCSTIGMVLGALISACTTAPSTTTATSAIMGGEVARPADFPTVVGLEDEPGAWFCTGTLIAPQWVLTAAHCVIAATSELHVRFDDADLNDTVGGRVIDAAAVHVHPEFDLAAWADAWDNDIALVRLSVPVTDRAPTPIHRAKVDFGSEVLDVGYGASDDDGSGGGILRRLVRTTTRCADAVDPKISDAVLVCMSTDDGRGSCFGDSGGPAFMTVGGERVVVGVTSGGSETGCGSGWDLYTSVFAELAFVDAVIAGKPDDQPPESDDLGGCSAARPSLPWLFALVIIATRRKRRASASLQRPRLESPRQWRGTRWATGSGA